MKQTKARKERLEKMVAERQAYWAAKRPNWTKEPIARIERPLKHIRSKCFERVQQEDGTYQTLVNPVYYLARDLAEAGDGHSVSLIARTLFSK